MVKQILRALVRHGLNLGLRSRFVNEKAQEFSFEGYRVVVLRRPYQRTLNLRVRPNGSLRITCHGSVKKEAIQSFISKNKKFVEKALHELRDLRHRFPRPDFLSGEPMMLLGQKLPLQVVWSWQKKPSVTFLEDTVELKIEISATREQRQKAIAKAYSDQARHFLTERIRHWAERMKLPMGRLSFRSQRTRWGSCSPDGSISLNWKLIAAPWPVIDYVLIHELAHLREPNHSSRFWKIVEAHCPDYRKWRKWLRDNQYEFEFLELKSELHAP